MINDRHKDRLFNFIFGRDENRRWTLSLYNALNGTAYTDPDEIEVTTISDVVYMSMKNDVSFLLQWTMNIWEHQSSFNPNMPVRELLYAGRLYDKYIRHMGLNIYGRKQLTLPVPKLVVFYNGTEEQSDDTVLRLRDSFPAEVAAESDIDVRVRMLNVNHGRNMRLMDSCKVLAEYAWLIERIRQLSTEMDIEQAVGSALDEMPVDYEIRDFLLDNRSEVTNMCITEYNETETMEMFKKEAREEGIKQGIQQGIQQGMEQGTVNGESRMGRLISKLLAVGRNEDAMRASTDADARARLYEELGIA